MTAAKVAEARDAHIDAITKAVSRFHRICKSHEEAGTMPTPGESLGEWAEMRATLDDLIAAARADGYAAGVASVAAAKERRAAEARSEDAQHERMEKHADDREDR